MNPLYYQWLEMLAKRDQAMLFAALTGMLTIGGWLALREVLPSRRVLVYGAVGFYYASLLVVVVWK
jgi:hypothetical protein